MPTIRTSLGDAWRLGLPYFSSDVASGLRGGRVDLSKIKEKWVGRSLLGLILTINVAQVGLSVLLNQWNGRFYNALQTKNLAAFTSELGVFALLAALFIILAVYELYLTQGLVLRWRTWMTRRYLERWTDGSVHYRMRLTGDQADNPDQRIADDIQQFAGGTLSIGIQLFSSVLSLAAFAGVLWGLSAAFPYRIDGFELSAVPGYLVWISVIYAALGTTLAHLIGRPLVGLDAERQRREADFRFGLARLRENAEPVAMLHGEAAERRDLQFKFGGIFDNTIAIMRRRKLLTFFSAGYQQVSIVAPFLLLSPAYFASSIGLGALTQTAGAFGNVQGSLSVFVNLYAALADYRAVVARLADFDRAVLRSARNNSNIVVSTPEHFRGIRIEGLSVRRENGDVLVKVPLLEAGPGEHILLMGPTGSGKTTLLRALAGLWPYADGKLEYSADARIFLMPQLPYIPWGTLRRALQYPTTEPIGDDEAHTVLTSVGLSHVIARLDAEAPWHRILSVGEAQRLGFARLILHAPNVIFLDEATSAIDEESERSLYRLLYRSLPRATVISIGHRASLMPLHERQLRLSGEADGPRGVIEERKVAHVAEAVA